MAEWKNINLYSMSPSGIVGCLEAAEIGIDITTEFLKAASTLFKIVENLIFPENPKVIKVLLDALGLSNEVFFYWDCPGVGDGNQKGTGMYGWMNNFGQSFNDMGDKNAPNYATIVPVGAVFVAIGFPDYKLLLATLDTIGRLFGIGVLIEISERSKAGFLAYRDNLKTYLPTPPDWRKGTIGDLVPVYTYLAKILNQLSDVLEQEGVKELLEEIIAVIDNTVQLLERLKRDIENLKNFIQALAEMGNLWGLAVESDGTAGVVTDLMGAGNQPPYGAGSYVLGICYLMNRGIGSSNPAWIGLKSMFGLVPDYYSAQNAPQGG